MNYKDGVVHESPSQVSLKKIVEIEIFRVFKINVWKACKNIFIHGTRWQNDKKNSSWYVLK